MIRDAHLLEEAGCFALVLEKIPAALAKRVASELTIPVIGIGAGGDVDGQVLVIQDMLGMNNGFRPRFLRRYADLFTVMTDAISRYVFGCEELRLPRNEKDNTKSVWKPIVDQSFIRNMYCQFFIVHILIYAFPGCSGRDGRSFRCSGVSNRSNVSFAYVGNVCYRAFSCLSGRCL